MTFFGYYSDADALRASEARSLIRDEAPEGCDLCGELEEDCQNGLGCIRCAHCKQKPGDCFDDCAESEHHVGCNFPSEDCRCRAIGNELIARAADVIAEEGLDAHREERAS